MSPREAEAMDWLRPQLEVEVSPTLDELAAQLRMSRVGAKYVVDRLVRAGQIERTPGKRRGMRLRGSFALQAVSSDRLRAELARRGETVEGLARHSKLAFDRRDVTCAHDGCSSVVSRGHLFCRPHWFSLPEALRDRLLAAFGAKDLAGYRAAFDEAKLRLEGAWRGV